MDDRTRAEYLQRLLVLLKSRRLAIAMLEVLTNQQKPTHAELARQWGISRSAVSHRISKARLMLAGRGIKTPASRTKKRAVRIESSTGWDV